jgi:hypothetical protein
MSGHTPGPWTAERDDDREEYTIGVPQAIGTRQVVTVAFGYSEPAETEQHANASLIAAAPDLLECLVEARERMLGSAPAITRLIAKTDAAIAKAARARPLTPELTNCDLCDIRPGHRVMSASGVEGVICEECDEVRP